MRRDTEALESLPGTEYSDASTLLSVAHCLGWNEERLFKAIDAMRQAKHIADLRDKKLS